MLQGSFRELGVRALKQIHLAARKYQEGRCLYFDVNGIVNEPVYDYLQRKKYQRMT